MGKVVWGAAVVGIALLVGGCNGSKPSAAPQASSDPTSAVASPSDSPTAVATATPGATASPSSVPTPSATTTPVAPHTLLISRRPVTSSGHLAPGYRITRRLNGASCSGGSEAFGAAYRCFTPGSEIFDPCWRFATQAPTVAVLCLNDPFSKDVTALTVRGTLEPIRDGSVPFGGAYPWGLRLSNGLTCVISQGAHDQYKGRVVDYYCGTFPAGVEVLRGLHRSGAFWTADTVRWVNHEYVLGPTLRITAAYYGRQ